MPVGRFEYNPGVSDQRAQIFQNSNAMFGQALMGLLTSMGRAREQKQLKLEALTHDAKSAEGAFNADLTTAGEDPAQEKDVLARWNVGSPQEWKTLSASDKVARRDGVIGAEQLLSLAQSRKKQVTDQQGAALLPKVLKTTADMQAGQPTVDEEGNAIPAQPTSKVLMKALGTLTPQEQTVFGQSTAGQNLLQRAMTAGERDDTTLAREDAINSRWTAREKGLSDRFDQREQRLSQTHDDNIKIAEGKLDSLNELRKTKGKVSPDTMYKAIEGTKRALITARTTAALFPGKEDQVKTIDAQLESLEGQQQALAAGGTAAAPAAGAVPTVTSQSEYDAIPAGGRFIDSTGVTKIKAGKAPQ